MEFSTEENILLSTVQAGDQTQQKKRDKCNAKSTSNYFVWEKNGHISTL